MKERLPIKGAILPVNGEQPDQVEAENGLEIPTKIVILGAGCSIFPPYGKVFLLILHLKLVAN
jgi:hypothetical protein